MEKPRSHLLLLALPFLLAAAAFLYGESQPSATAAAALPPHIPDSTQVRLAQMQAPASVAGDSLSEQALLQHLSHLYRLQADVLAAEARTDAAQAARLLDEALATLRPLTQQPAATNNPRFRDLYQAFVGTYKAHYGALPDSLEIAGGSVFEERAHLFAALEEIESPLTAEPFAADVQAIETEVPMTMNRVVQGAIRYLLREPEKHLYRWMNRAETYFPMIEHIFAEEDVPDELKYLVLVESGLNIRARSWAQAAGPWQFMEATGRAYGMEINPWVDERLDPEKATRAAALHLRDLYHLFDGDWLLALAGYNCSPTVIREALAKARERLGREPTFWDIYEDIPQETRNYVPTYIAAALMVSNPAAFDLRHVLPGPRYEFDVVPVRGMLPLEQAAALAGTDVPTLRALNPELRRSTLPPQRKPYSLRIPFGRYEQFIAGYQQLSDSARGAVAVHRVRPDETLDEIARRYDLAVAELMEANALKRGTLRVGQELMVPAANYKGGRGDQETRQLSEATPRRVRYNTRSLRPVAGLSPDQQTDHSVIMHRVRPHETLLEIAEHYDVSVPQLKRWNDLPTSALRPGQRLKIYT